jgi:hypothetical protein
VVVKEARDIIDACGVHISAFKLRFHDSKHIRWCARFGRG